MISTQNREETARLGEDVATLHSQLSDAHEELTNMRFMKEELELRAQTVEKAVVVVDDERLRANEEKFQRLKVMYTQIRDEHVKLLRQVCWKWENSGFLIYFLLFWLLKNKDKLNAK